MADSKNAVVKTEFSARRQKRALLTKQELLLSARQIFARDGFEDARLEDIASSIGKTRGALYGNFKNKEDVFCAIFEQNIERDRAELGPLLAGLPSVEKRIEALIKYLIGVSRDRERMLLNLEFKLYAIRHPRRRKRLARLHDAMCLQISIPELSELLQQLGRRSPKAKSIGSLALSGIVDGLVLNHLFNPDVLNSRELTRYLKLCLSKILDVDAMAVGETQGGRLELEKSSTIRMCGCEH